jgi:hypothetical protein
MEKLLAALIPVLCVVAFGPLFCPNMGTTADQNSARQAPDGGSRFAQRNGCLCEVTR